MTSSLEAPAAAGGTMPGSARAGKESSFLKKFRHGAAKRALSTQYWVRRTRLEPETANLVARMAVLTGNNTSLDALLHTLLSNALTSKDREFLASLDEEAVQAEINRLFDIKQGGKTE